MNRRHFLSAASTSALALAGCAKVEPKDEKARTRGEGVASGSHPARVPSEPPVKSWAELRKLIRGRIVTEADSDFRASHLLHNSAYDRIRPQGVVQVADAMDVAHCIRFAHAAGLPLAVRSGGHSYLGASVSEGLVIHLGGLTDVTVDASSNRVSVGTGIQLIDFYSKLASFHRSIPGGSCPTVGLGGLALGGGHGLTSRAHGLTCDRLVSVEVVTASGEVVEVSAAENPDLFWALRGGGGNFGVATRFIMTSEPEPPKVTTIMLLYKWENAGEALERWMRWIVDLPRDLSVVARLASTGTLVIAGVYLGEVEQAQDLVRPLLPGVDKRSIQPHSLFEAMMLEAGCSQRSLEECHLAATSKDGKLKRALPFAASSLYFEKPLDSDAIRVALSLVDGYRTRFGGGAASIQFDAYGGAINDVAPDSTAFCHRRAVCCAQIASTFSKGDETPQRKWVSDTRQALAPFGNGQSYQSYNDASLRDYGQAYYGQNYERLLALKRRFDPANVFRFAQSLA